MVLTAAKTGRPDRAQNAINIADKPGLAARLCAQRLLAAVIETSTSLDGLTDDDHGHPQYRALEMRDRSLVRAILSSALRHRGTVSAFLARLLDKPLPENAKSLSHLLHVAAAQILFLGIPDHSAVDLAVEAARADPRNGRFASLVNALLRRMAREKADILPTCWPRHAMCRTGSGTNCVPSTASARRSISSPCTALKRRWISP